MKIKEKAKKNDQNLPLPRIKTAKKLPPGDKWRVPKKKEKHISNERYRRTNETKEKVKNDQNLLLMRAKDLQENSHQAIRN